MGLNRVHFATCDPSFRQHVSHGVLDDELRCPYFVSKWWWKLWNGKIILLPMVETEEIRSLPFPSLFLHQQWAPLGTRRCCDLLAVWLCAVGLEMTKEGDEHIRLTAFVRHQEPWKTVEQQHDSTSTVRRLHCLTIIARLAFPFKQEICLVWVKYKSGGR